MNTKFPTTDATPTEQEDDKFTTKRTAATTRTRWRNNRSDLVGVAEGVSKNDGVESFYFCVSRGLEQGVNLFRCDFSLRLSSTNHENKQKQRNHEIYQNGNGHLCPSNLNWPTS